MQGRARNKHFSLKGGSGHKDAGFGAIFEIIIKRMKIGKMPVSRMYIEKIKQNTLMNTNF